MKTGTTKISVSPIFDPWYYEFYLKGLMDFYGSDNVKFDYSNEYVSLTNYANTEYRKDFFYYEVKVNGMNKKVTISAEDWTNINEELYDKVDCYAKVNVSEEKQENYSKLFPIGPNFGIRFLHLGEYLQFSANLKIKAGIVNPYLKTFFKLSLKRSFYNIYESASIQQDNYIFYLNYPWKKHTEVTENRGLIIDKLKNLDEQGLIRFEGGFSKRRLGYQKGLKKNSAHKIYGHAAYLEQIKRSSLVINTPAVHDCLGWKLGEYLALGKAIVSLPLKERVMPGNFRKGIHYHEIKNTNSDLKESIKLLLNDQEYASFLKNNAYNYYQSFLKPVKVIERIHNRLFNIT